MNKVVLTIPDFDPDVPETYPGDIKPGDYTINELVKMLRQYADDPEAIRFIADMLEE